MKLQTFLLATLLSTSMTLANQPIKTKENPHNTITGTVGEIIIYKHI